MNRDQIQGRWRQIIGRAQEHYGVLKQDAEKQIDGLMDKVLLRDTEPKPSDEKADKAS